MLSEKSDRNTEILNELGVDPDASSIYLFLSKNGASTALEISRNTRISRTKVYDRLDRLTTLGLVEQVLKSRGFVFQLSSPNNIYKLLEDKRKTVKRLEDSLPDLIETINNNAHSSASFETNLKYYKGEEGLKQVTWNSLKARDTIYIYEMAQNMSDFLDEDFSESVRKEIVKRNIKVKQITNHKKIKEFTRVTEKVLSHWEVRYIDSSALDLSYEVLLYNDILCMYNFKGNVPFCIEIKDMQLVNMQLDLFNFVWNKAKKMKVLNEYGKAEVYST